MTDANVKILSNIIEKHHNKLKLTEEELILLHSPDIMPNINPNLFVKQGTAKSDDKKVKKIMKMITIYKLQLYYVGWNIPLPSPLNYHAYCDECYKQKKIIKSNMQMCENAITILSNRCNLRYPAGIYENTMYYCSLQNYPNKNAIEIREERWDNRANWLMYLQHHQHSKVDSTEKILSNPDLQRYITEYL